MGLASCDEARGVTATTGTVFTIRALSLGVVHRLNHLMKHSICMKNDIRIYFGLHSQSIYLETIEKQYMYYVNLACHGYIYGYIVKDIF